jgi:hypothetical protein
MSKFVGEILGILVFAVCMTAMMALPVFLVMRFPDILREDQPIQFMIFLGFGLVFFMFAGVLGVVKHRKRLQVLSLRQGSEKELREETRLIQEVCKRAGQMERRLASLETVLPERVVRREGILR